MTCPRCGGIRNPNKLFCGACDYELRQRSDAAHQEREALARALHPAKGRRRPREFFVHDERLPDHRDLRGDFDA